MFKNVNIKARAANAIYSTVRPPGDTLFTDLTIEDCKMTNLTKAMYYVSENHSRNRENYTEEFALRIREYGQHTILQHQRNTNPEPV